MTFNKPFQYAFLICSYLARAGRATAKDMAANLNVPEAELKPIIKQLKKFRYITYRTGTGGGYRLKPGLQVYQIYQLYHSHSLLTSAEHFKYSKGEFENRALATFASIVGQLMFTQFMLSFTKLNKEIGKIEQEQFENLENTLEN